MAVNFRREFLPDEGAVMMSAPPPAPAPAAPPQGTDPYAIAMGQQTAPPWQAQPSAASMALREDAAGQLAAETPDPWGPGAPQVYDRYLAAEYEDAMLRYRNALERLGIAEKYSAVSQLSERYIPEQVTGGGGKLKALKFLYEHLGKRVEGQRAQRGQDIQAAGTIGTIDRESMRAAREGAKEEGSLTANIGGVEYVVRPGTSEKEMIALRDLGAAGSTFQQKAEELRSLKRTDPDYFQKRDTLVEDIMVAKSLLRGQGTVTNPEAKRGVDNLQPALILGQGGPAALEMLAKSMNAEARIRATALGGKKRR